MSRGGGRRGGNTPRDGDRTRTVTKHLGVHDHVVDEALDAGLVRLAVQRPHAHRHVHALNGLPLVVQTFLQRRFAEAFVRAQVDEDLGAVRQHLGLHREARLRRHNDAFRLRRLDPFLRQHPFAPGQVHRHCRCRHHRRTHLPDGVGQTGQVVAVDGFRAALGQEPQRLQVLPVRFRVLLALHVEFVQELEDRLLLLFGDGGRHRAAAAAAAAGRRVIPCSACNRHTTGALLRPDDVEDVHGM